jgi:hypothetical protein
MALFSRRDTSAGRNASQLQPPDQLALKARELYGSQRFTAAFEAYASAVDKIHTMCVMAEPSSRRRQPGPGDQAILDGLVSAAGAALAMDPALDLKPTAIPTMMYLVQIAREASHESDRYLNASKELERIVGI